jgi:hypothetical protein
MKYKYVFEDKVILKTHHIKPAVITRIDKGFNSVYDITEKDILNQYIKYIKIARGLEIPVVLTVRNITRILIFDREL